MEEESVALCVLSDHAEYRAPRFFMCVPKRVVSHGLTPAVWPKGGTLSSAAGPCVSGARWAALLRLASVRSNEPRRGVKVLKPFSGTKGPRLSGRNPATQNITLIGELGTYVRGVHLPALFCWKPPKWLPDIQRKAVRPEP